MMELTKANIDIGQVGQWEDPHTWQCTMQFFESKEEAEKVKQQLLGDYEKARQLDRFTESNLPSLMNFKLRELIEKSIEENERYKNDPDSGGLYYELQNLLEESKK